MVKIRFLASSILWQLLIIDLFNPFRILKLIFLHKNNYAYVQASFSFQPKLSCFLNTKAAQVLANQPIRENKFRVGVSSAVHPNVFMISVVLKTGLIYLTFISDAHSFARAHSFDVHCRSSCGIYLLASQTNQHSGLFPHFVASSIRTWLRSLLAYFYVAGFAVISAFAHSIHPAFKIQDEAIKGGQKIQAIQHNSLIKKAKSEIPSQKSLIRSQINQSYSF